MAKAKMTHDWDMTSTMWATIANANRDPKRKSTPFLPTDIHPFRQDEPEQKPTLPFSALKVLLNGWQGKGNQGRRGVH